MRPGKPNSDCGGQAAGHGVRRALRLFALRAIARRRWLPRQKCGPATLPRSILLIRPDHLGDMLFTTPAVRHLRRAWPSARLTMLCGPWAQTVAERNPHLDEVLTCRFPWFSRQPRQSLLEPYLLLRHEARRIEERDFDLAIVMRFDHWWGAWLSHCARIPWRVGYDIPEVVPFLTRVVSYTPGQHEVLQNMALVEAVTGLSSDMEDGRLEFRIADGERDDAARLLASLGVRPEDRLVCVHPGAGAPVKLWDNRSWAQVIRVLMQEYQAKVILSGGPDEVGLVRELEDFLAAGFAGESCADVMNLAGRTNLGQLAAVMQRCHLVLGVDSGPLHLAVAVSAPTVHLFGPVDAHLFGPWGDAERHVAIVSPRGCVPCNRLDYTRAELDAHPCMREITVEAVLSAARRLMDATSQA